MTTIRTKKNKNYTTISNVVLNDVALSWKAKGLAAYLLSKPDAWRISREHLAKQSEDGISAVRSALQELEKFGYLVRQKARNDRGIIEWEYVLLEEPQDRQPLQEKSGERKKKGVPPSADYQPMVEPVPPSADFPPVENPPVENRTLVSTDIVSTDIVSTEKGESARANPVVEPEPTPPPASPPPPPPSTPVAHKQKALVPNDSYDLTPSSFAPRGFPMRQTPVSGSSTPPPVAGGSPARKRALAPASPHFDPRKLKNGYIPAGQGATAIEVYFERYHASEYKLNAPNQDDIMRAVKELDRWRETVIAWQQSGYNPKNIKGQLDWYRDGIPERNGNGNHQSSTGFGLTAYAEKERKQYDRDFGPDEELTPEKRRSLEEYFERRRKGENPGV